MGDAFQKVRTGQSLQIPAQAYNGFVDAAVDFQARQQQQRRAARDGFLQTGVVKIKNNCGEDRNRFDVLGIEGPLFTPDDNEVSFTGELLLTGVTPDAADHFGKFVILLEPLVDGAIGRACLSGGCPARVQVDDPDDEFEFADVTDGEAGHLLAGDNGSAFILWRDDGEGEKWAYVRLSNITGGMGGSVSTSTSGSDSGGSTSDGSGGSGSGGSGSGGSGSGGSGGSGSGGSGSGGSGSGGSGSGSDGSGSGGSGSGDSGGSGSGSGSDGSGSGGSGSGSGSSSSSCTCGDPATGEYSENFDHAGDQDWFNTGGGSGSITLDRQEVASTLLVGDYDMTLPTGKTVCGIIVVVNVVCGNNEENGIEAGDVHFTANGKTSESKSLCSAPEMTGIGNNDCAWPTGATDLTLGGVGDTWGEDWTTDDFLIMWNDPGALRVFLKNVEQSLDNDEHDATVNSISVQICYYP